MAFLAHVTPWNVNAQQSIPEKELDKLRIPVCALEKTCITRVCHSPLILALVGSYLPAISERYKIVRLFSAGRNWLCSRAAWPVGMRLTTSMRLLH
jgi:hypothetical protein